MEKMGFSLLRLISRSLIKRKHNTLLKIKEEEEQRQEEDEESEVKKKKHESDAEFKEVSSYGDMKRLKERKIMNIATNMNYHS
ncbi:hypothetical protein YC2023_042957 [Brassica napus]